MYRLATNAIVNVPSPPITAARSGIRTKAAPARRTITTTPPSPSSVRAGIVAGMLDAHDLVSKVTSPITVAGPGKRIHGNSPSRRRASGRRICSSCVGRNFSPNKLPPLSARARRRATLNCEYTCLSSGNPKNVPKRE
jgi:hypothetical protein